MAVKTTIEMPRGDTYRARIGHWWPKLLGSDDSVWGQTAYFRISWYEDGTLASPSPGHLVHAGVHVRQFRWLRKKLWLFAYLWWPIHWLLNQKQMEAEADADAETYRQHARMVEQWEYLRANIRRPSWNG